MNLKTIKGYTPEEATKLMIEPLGAGAYKKHPTKSYLTTISPAYTRERLTKVFGMVGVGWGLDWETENIREYETQTSKGKTRYHFAFIKADFWYTLESDGDLKTFHIPVTGENDNDNLGDAMSGARTSAIGQGAKELLFQLHVYKDMPAPPPQQQKKKHPAQKETAVSKLTKKQESKLDELIEAIKAADSLTIGLVCDYAFQMDIGYNAAQHCLNAIKTVPSHESDKMTDAIENRKAVDMLNWLVNRKTEA